MTKTTHIAGILFASIFGLTFLFSKIALDYISPLGLIAYRFLIAYVAIELLRLLKVIQIKIDKSQLKYLIAVALFQPVLYFLFETYGLSLVSSGEAGMMIALIPIFVALLSTFMIHEKPKPIQVIFILLSVTGVLIIQLGKLGDAENSEFLGFILLIFAVLSAAFFNIASRTASLKGLKPLEVTYFMMLFGAVIFNLMYVVELIIQKDIQSYLLLFNTSKLLLPILYLGLVASIGGFFLVNLVLSKVPAHISSIYANLSTVVAILCGILFLDEKITLFHIIGSLLIIGGVYGTVLFNRKPKSIT